MFAQANSKATSLTRESPIPCVACRIPDLKSARVLGMGVLSDLQSLSTQGHTGDALAFVGDEGRDKLRKAPVRRTWPFDPEISEWDNPAAFMRLSFF